MSKFVSYITVSSEMKLFFNITAGVAYMLKLLHTCQQRDVQFLKSEQ